MRMVYYLDMSTTKEGIQTAVIEITSLETQVTVDIYALITMYGLVLVCFHAWLIAAVRNKNKTQTSYVSHLSQC